MNLRVLAAAAALAISGTFAQAGVTSVPFASDVSQHHLGQFKGTATYDSSDAKLTLVVQNTTSLAVGGYLTGIAFDASGIAAKYADPDGGHKPNTNGFDELRNRNGNIQAAPFGTYHAGTALDGRWVAGGATRGIGAGTSQTFVFDITAANASSLTAADFLTPGRNGQEIVAAFKKLHRDRSDRAGAIINGAMTTFTSSISGTGNDTGSGGGNTLPQPVGDPGLVVLTPSAVPLPPAVWMALTTLGLAGTVMLKRKQNVMV